MSHNIHYSTYPELIDKNRVQAEWDTYAAREDWQEGCSGLPKNIRWMSNSPFKSYDKAKEYIESIDSGNYDQIAVRYFEYPEFESSKTLENLKRISLDAHKRYIALSLEPHFKDAKSELISCRNCGSKISRKYLTGNNCPVCRADMRPDSTLKRINQLKKSAESATQNYENRRQYEKEKTKPIIKWLVKIEYHT